jgi:hypothetical protein
MFLAFKNFELSSFTVLFFSCFSIFSQNESFFFKVANPFNAPTKAFPLNNKKNTLLVLIIIK